MTKFVPTNKNHIVQLLVKLEITTCEADGQVEIEAAEESVRRAIIGSLKAQQDEGFIHDLEDEIAICVDAVEVVKPKYARVAWSTSDIADLFHLTEEQADAFLRKHEKDLAGLMVDRGWTAIEDLAAADGLKRNDEY